jgi:hypothetical protein
MNSTLEGNVIITPEASGDIQFLHYGLINGTVTSESNSLLKSLKFDFRYSIVYFDGSIGAILLRNLTSFETISAPAIKELAGSFYPRGSSGSRNT